MPTNSREFLSYLVEILESLCILRILVIKRDSGKYRINHDVRREHIQKTKLALRLAFTIYYISTDVCWDLRTGCARFSRLLGICQIYLFIYWLGVSHASALFVFAELLPLNINLKSNRNWI